MSKPKPAVTLPTISKQSSPKHAQNVKPQRTSSLGQALPLPTLDFGELIVRRNIKRLSLWFRTWHTWQRRVFICRLMEHCSRQQLELLATALEPTLHLDFSSSLLPHMASLHLDGVATFQIQRGVLQSVIRPEVLEADSGIRLDSLPTTLMTDSVAADSSKAGATQNQLTVGSTRVARSDIGGGILPVLPLSHVDHATALSLQQPSLGDAVTLRRKRFSSVPDFKSTTDLLKQVKHKESLKPRFMHHRRSRSTGVYTITRRGSNRQAEHFKEQLAVVSEWLLQWQAPQKVLLFLEVIKLCDKELLGYSVQCLHQRLQERVSMESLPDQTLLEVFSHLDPQSLCRCAQVCRRWHHLCSSGVLWRAHVGGLGRREGVGDLAGAVEMGEGWGVEEGRVIDWRRAYYVLSKVMFRIKSLVVRAASAAMEQEAHEQQQVSPKLSDAALRANLSLKEMLELLRYHTPTRPSTTQELVRSAPESAVEARRRLRTERRAAQAKREREERERLEVSRYQHRRPYDRGSRPATRLTSLSPDLPAPSSSASVPGRSAALEGSASARERVQLVQVALDMRPSVPYLPDPDGIQCLILAGCLKAGQLPKPGRVQPIPRLRRLKQFDSPVLCLQCDQRKIVAGTADREIHVHDIRSGRHVHTLLGHRGSVQCLQFDDHKIVSGSWDTTCIVWDVVHFTAIRELHGHSDCVSCLQFDEERLVTGSYDKSLRIWSTTSWDCSTVIGHAHRAAITCLRFSDVLIASGSRDKSVRLWSHAGRPLASLEQGGALTSLLLSHLLLLTASSDGKILLWGLPSHSLLMQWAVEGSCITALAGVATRVFGAGSDSVLYEWDIATGTCSRTLAGHSGPLTAVWGGHHKLVTASEDNTVCVWYSKQAVTKEEEVEEIDPTFLDIPIRVITQ